MQDTDSCVSKDCVNTQNTEIDNCSVNAVAIEVMGTKTNVHHVRGCHKANGRSERKPEPACEFPFSLSVTDALHIQQKLDETTKLLRDLQEAQKERLSAKQPPNMICLLAPTVKELELGKSRAGHGLSLPPLNSYHASCRPPTTRHSPSVRPPTQNNQPCYVFSFGFTSAELGYGCSS